MVFSSLLFIFLFLVTNLIVYTLVDKKYKNPVLLGFSLFFYAWGGPQYLILLLLETFISWICAVYIEKEPERKKLWMILESAALIGLLAVFKYADFVLGNIQNLTGWPKSLPGILLPIGISFYTFQLLSYVIDVYRGQVHAQPKYWKLLLYSSLFHQCIAGPIVRYETVADEIDNRTVNMNDIYYGIRRFSIGLAKKAILANGCAQIADTLLPFDNSALSGLPFSAYWLGMIAYTLQIYLDFSAYSDMAIGLGRMVGFHYLENFNYPYTAISVQDFWRRWHISLSTFFRDYVYIPLGGNRGTVWMYVRNMIVVWLLTGLWHGASWNYIGWGVYYLIFLLLEKFVIKQKIPNFWNRIYTLSVVVIGWTIFRFENTEQLLTVLKGMIGIGISGFTNAQVHSIFLKNIFLLALSIISCTQLSKMLHNLLFHFGKENTVSYWIYNIFEAVTPSLLLIISSLALIGNAYNPFLYFQF